jgi:hypothetical protein
MLVLFDSVWDPNPKIGKQRAPMPGIHNSGWVQSPGAKALSDSSEHPRLEKYVKDVVGRFAKDRRINSWDVWNEPDNRNARDYARQDPPNKIELVNNLLTKSLCLGAFRQSRTAAHVRRLERRLREGRKTRFDGTNPTRRVGFHYFSHI